MVDNRTRRSVIIDALRDKIKTISLDNGYKTDLGGNAHSRLLFPDDIHEFPCVCLTAGLEQIVHQGAGMKDRYLSVTVRCYVNNEDPIPALEGLLEDLEFIIDNNGRLAYLDSSSRPETTRDIVIQTIDTDQGTLAPLGVGEITLQVKY